MLQRFHRFLANNWLHFFRFFQKTVKPDFLIFFDLFFLLNDAESLGKALLYKDFIR